MNYITKSRYRIQL